MTQIYSVMQNNDGKSSVLDSLTCSYGNNWLNLSKQCIFSSSILIITLYTTTVQMQNQKFSFKCTSSSFLVWFNLFKPRKQVISWFYNLEQRAFTLISKQEQTNPNKEEPFQVSLPVQPIQGNSSQAVSSKMGNPHLFINNLDIYFTCR